MKCQQSSVGLHVYLAGSNHKTAGRLYLFLVDHPGKTLELRCTAKLHNTCMGGKKTPKTAVNNIYCAFTITR